MKASRFGALGLILAVLCSFAILAGSERARAAELLMFERVGCAYCLRWSAEVGPSYVISQEAKLAPLRKIDLGHGQPRDVRLSGPVRFTPTFVLVDGGKEVGRITGYFDNAMFWGLIEKMIAGLPARH